MISHVTIKVLSKSSCRQNAIYFAPHVMGYPDNSNSATLRVYDCAE